VLPPSAGEFGTLLRYFWLSHLGEREGDMNYLVVARNPVKHFTIHRTVFYKKGVSNPKYQ
jgi:hypothetical protein